MPRLRLGPSILQQRRFAPRRRVLISERLRPELRQQRDAQLELDLERGRLRNSLLRRVADQIGDIGQPEPGDRSRVDALFEQFGQSGRDRIDRSFQESLQGDLARLSDRGLGSSTLTANISQGAQQRRQESLNNLNDQLLSRRINFEQDELNRNNQLQAGLIGQLLRAI